jgi:hypothetical protein
MTPSPQESFGQYFPILRLRTVGITGSHPDSRTQQFLTIQQFSHPTMLTYSLQVTVCWAFFYAAYFALLSRETFFYLNRLWLLLSLVSGLVLPLVAPLFEVAPTEPVVIFLEPFTVTATALRHNLQNTEGGLLQLLGWVYAAGVVVVLSRMVFGFYKIFRLLRQSPVERHDPFKIVVMEAAQPPFSFFNHIFINPNLVEAADFQYIMRHEQAHIEQRHSYDVLFMELLTAVFWWCPLVYMFKKSLRNVHEYAADAAVLQTAVTPLHSKGVLSDRSPVGQYGRLLLRQNQSGMSLALANHFFSQLKKRILMMTRHKSKRRMLVKYVLAAPIFTLLVVLLASPKTQVLAETKNFTETATAEVKNFEKAVVGKLENVDNQSLVAKKVNAEMRTVSDDVPFGFYLGDNQKGGAITTEAFNSNTKLRAYEVKAGKTIEGEITSFTMVRVPRYGDPVQVNVVGNSNSEMLKLIGMATAGDLYQFLSITGKEMGINTARALGSMSFFIRGNTPQYSAPKDTDKVKLSEIPPSDIAKIDIDKSNPNAPKIFITLKNGQIKEYSKADMDELQSKDSKMLYKVVERTSGNGTIESGNNKIETRTYPPVEERVVVKKETRIDSKIEGIPESEIDAIYLDEANPKAPMTVHLKNGQKRVFDKAALKRYLERKSKESTQYPDPSVKVYKPKNPETDIYTIVEQQPEFPGGMAAMFKFLGQNIKYPAKARENGAEGTVYVGFIVEKDGAITNVTVKRGVPTIVRDTIELVVVGHTKGNKIVTREIHDLDDEAKRVIGLMPKWKPGRSQGQVVRVAYTLPIKSFALIVFIAILSIKSPKY